VQFGVCGCKGLPFIVAKAWLSVGEMKRESDVNVKYGVLLRDFCHPTVAPICGNGTLLYSLALRHQSL
jgi:hypothetical protein